jgi:hypothetical protein
MGREIEFRQGIGWPFLEKKTFPFLPGFPVRIGCVGFRVRIFVVRVQGGLAAFVTSGNRYVSSIGS